MLHMSTTEFMTMVVTDLMVCFDDDPLMGTFSKFDLLHRM
jgi:hypothetical protein